MKKRFKLDLQMFNGETEPTPEPTPEVKVTQADIEAWKKTEEGKKYFQSITDGAVTKGLKTWQENNLSKYVPKEDYEKIVKESSEKVQALTLSQEINAALSSFKHSKLLAKEINKDNLKITENGIIGLNEEIERLKKEYPDLTIGQTQQPTQTKPTTNGIPANTTKTTGDLTKEEIEKLPMKERLEYKARQLREKNKK